MNFLLLSSPEVGYSRTLPAGQGGENRNFIRTESKPSVGQKCGPAHLGILLLRV